MVSLQGVITLDDRVPDRTPEEEDDLEGEVEEAQDSVRGVSRCRFLRPMKSSGYSRSNVHHSLSVLTGKQEHPNQTEVSKVKQELKDTK